MATSSDAQRQQQQQQQHVLYGNEYVSGDLLTEYQSLQRQLNILESDRRLHALEASEAARRQQADLQRLERENAELKRGLSASRSQSALRERKTETRRIRELVAELESLEAEVRRTRETHQQLDARIREAQRPRRAVNGSTAISAERGLQESVVLHEKKLESRCVKYQTVVWQNSKLRESLDHLRADRQKFLTVRKRLQNELDRLQKRRGDLTADATDAYRESEDARRRVKELQERERLAVAEHLQRVKLLYREIDFHDTVGTFVHTKWHTRSPDPELQRLREDLERRRRVEGERRAADDEDLQRSFDLMRRRYKAGSLDDMVRHYLRVEEENFSLFRYCTAAQAEVATLTADVDRLAADIRREGLEEVRLVEGRSQLLTELTGRLAEAKADRLKRAEKLRVVSGVLDALKQRTAAICDRVGAVRWGEEVVTDGGGALLNSLGCLEVRVVDLLAVRHSLQLQPQAPRSLPPPQHLDLADRLRLPDVDETDVEVRATVADRLLSERPLTKEEIMEKLLNEIAM